MNVKTTGQLILMLLVWSCAVQALESMPYFYGPRSYDQAETEDADPEMMFAILARLGQTIIRANDLENSKRGLDLGLSRGYSGSQQAKHMMGIAAAGLSGGPGRRRRSQDSYPFRYPY